jgi:hypothetical protein
MRIESKIHPKRDVILKLYWSFALLKFLEHSHILWVNFWKWDNNSRYRTLAQKYITISLNTWEPKALDWLNIME